MLSSCHNDKSPALAGAALSSLSRLEVVDILLCRFVHAGLEGCCELPIPFGFNFTYVASVVAIKKMEEVSLREDATRYCL